MFLYIFSLNKYFNYTLNLKFICMHQKGNFFIYAFIH